MDAFGRRISLDEAAAVVQSAQLHGPLTDAPSAIFHNLHLMQSRLAELKSAFPPNTLHAIAIKANPVLEILRAVVQEGCGLEAASIEEVQLALAAGCPPQRVIFDSPAKTTAEIRQALNAGIYLNVDNFEELHRIATELQTRASNSVVGLRVNPQVGGGTISLTSVANTDSKFGIPLSTNRAAILEAFASHAWLRGLHIHVGSQGCAMGLLTDAITIADTLRKEIEQHSGQVVTHLDIGGGLPTVYQSDLTAPTPAEYVAEIRKRAPDVLSPDLQRITEFGRAVQANCGFAASRVEYYKPAQQMAVIHLGADFLLRPVYRPEDWPHEFFVLDAQGFPKTGETRPVTIVGPLCFGGDIVARDVQLPPIEAGDWIVIRDVGAYTLSMWSRHCSRGIPAVIGYEPDRLDTMQVLRPAESPEDIVRYWGHGEQI
ncbi:Diaminopimelate decarboxylase [Symmachiella dynata]|uniref:Diaminopimelate decarboxylase n=1 Tax=Symmachiella dynata TaxID=2527995 RepID=A0A517ZT66_9PLAN|nr:diaminopimelate decarboxylase [Symmachiella dynata]QDU45687.1 Diaminopimelate decarboxylase [Symmachiella dynata]